ncbi:hypothetical protein CYMTET_10584 [Cymbomonas tetramitiformis]|uniref:Uncharacterized protein n=1 Tax=Cymbomonas tetramitiformis TaxID=36881 RepID=A0AAE0GPF9_9CHLO|nr:hypothetical protein CYMTET_10584 [Cymbomonas tetramitiformis]
MADQKSEQVASEHNSGALEQPEPKIGMEALLEQQGAMMKLMMEQMKSLNARVEVAEEAAAKAASQAGGSALSGDAELEELKKLPYLVLAPALSYMHDAIAYSEVTLDWCQDEKDAPSVEELSERVYAAHTTFKGVFSLLSNRYTMLQLRASMEADATSHDGAEALRAKLAFIEEKVYAGSDGLVSDSVLTKWLKEFDTTKAKAVIQTHAKASAKVSTFRDRQGVKGKGAAGGGAGKGEGGRGSGKGGKGAGLGRGAQVQT